MRLRADTEHPQYAFGFEAGHARALTAADGLRAQRDACAESLAAAEESMATIAHDLKHGMHPDDGADYLARSCEKARATLIATGLWDQARKAIVRFGGRS